MSRLILGTAEFNPEGYAGKKCPDKREIVRILNLAWEAGIYTLDTAEAYNCEETIANYASWFTRINKSRNVNMAKTYYHYQQDEKAFHRQYASVYTLEQFHNTTEQVIVPFNINNVEFAGVLHDKQYAYIRSVFDRGRLLKQGYTVKDCLSFVKRHRNDGVIVGVCKEKELVEVLKAWGI